MQTIKIQHGPTVQHGELDSTSCDNHNGEESEDICIICMYPSFLYGGN